MPDGHRVCCLSLQRLMYLAEMPLLNVKLLTDWTFDTMVELSVLVSSSF